MRAFVTDPFDVPRLQSLISKNVAPASKLNHDRIRWHRVTKATIPPEIEGMILDHLTPRDMEAFCDMLDQKIPQTWCRSSVLKRWRVFLDVDSVRDRPLDWRAICFFLEKNPPLGIWNRDRIFRIIESICEEFYSLRTGS